MRSILEIEVLRTGRKYFNHGSSDNLRHWRHAQAELIHDENASNAEQDQLDKLIEGARKT